MNMSHEQVFQVIVICILLKASVYGWNEEMLTVYVVYDSILGIKNSGSFWPSISKICSF